MTGRRLSEERLAEIRARIAQDRTSFSDAVVLLHELAAVTRERDELIEYGDSVARDEMFAMRSNPDMISRAAHHIAKETGVIDWDAMSDAGKQHYLTLARLALDGAFTIAPAGGAVRAGRRPDRRE